jgi:hypothetical protein
VFDIQSFLIGLALGVIVGLYLVDTIRWLHAMTRRVAHGISRRWGRASGGP